MSVETLSHKRHVFSRLLIIPEGGFPNSVTLLLRALLHSEIGFLPQTLRFRVFDFMSDSPRVPAAEFPDIPLEVWDQVDYREEEKSLFNNRRDVRDIVRRIESPEGDLNWLGSLYWPGLLERYGGQEAAQIPRLAAFFAALEAHERRRFGRTWLEQLALDLQDLRPESPRTLEVLTRGVRAVSMPDEKRVGVIHLMGSRGATGNGLSQALALSTRDVSRQAGIDIELIGVVLTGPYRNADGNETAKEALEYALLKEIEDSMAWNAMRHFPISADETFQHSGPLWDSVFRIETTAYMAHNQAAAMLNAARILRLMFFTRTGYEWRKNFGNDQMRLKVTELASLAS
jgi:hypothetical protein